MDGISRWDQFDLKRRKFSKWITRQSRCYWANSRPIWPSFAIKTLCENVSELIRCLGKSWAAASLPLITCRGRNWVPSGARCLGLELCGTASRPPRIPSLTGQRKPLCSQACEAGWRTAPEVDPHIQEGWSLYSDRSSGLKRNVSGWEPHSPELFLAGQYVHQNLHQILARWWRWLRSTHMNIS